MTNNQKNIGQDFIGNLLSEDLEDDFSYLRKEIGKSTSAPPPGLSDTLFSTYPEMNSTKDTKNNQIDYSTKEYYMYYHSQKPLDPRLPLPSWKPYGGNYSELHTIKEEDNDFKKSKFVNAQEEDLTEGFEQMKIQEKGGFKKEFKQTYQDKKPIQTKQY